MAIDWRRLPHLPRENDDRTAIGEYRRDLSRVLIEKFRDDAQRLDVLERGGTLVAWLNANQSLTPNVVTTVAFDTVTDPLGFWNATAHQYVPRRAGWYRCAWSVVLHDDANIAAGTFCYSLLKADASWPAVNYGSGIANVPTQGEMVVACNGTTDAIYVQAYVQTASAPVIYGSRFTRLAIDYLGMR